MIKITKVSMTQKEKTFFYHLMYHNEESGVTGGMTGVFKIGTNRIPREGSIWESVSELESFVMSQEDEK